MYSFSEFLIEGVETNHEYHESQYMINHNYHHDGVPISIYYEKSDYPHPHTYDVSFSVADKYMHNNLPKTKNLEILRSINHHIGKFVNREKPHELSFMGNTDKKHKIYGQYVKRLAKQTNGVVTGDNKYHIIKYKKGA